MRKQIWEINHRYMRPDNRIFNNVTNKQEFLNSLVNGGDVILFEDIEVEEAIVINKDTTINLNGHVLKANKSIYIPGTVSALVCAKEGATVRIYGNGIIDGSATDDYAVETRGGNIIIENGLIIGATTAVYSIEGHIEILGGEFKATPYEGDYRYTLNLKDSAGKEGKALIQVKGGRFHNFNPSENLSENPAFDFVSEGYEAIEIDLGIWEVRNK